MKILMENIISNIYFIVFMVTFLIRNPLEVHRVVRFKLGVPAHGKATLAPLFTIYCVVNLIFFYDLYAAKGIRAVFYAAGIGLYTISYILREIATWQMKTSYTNEINPTGALMLHSGFFKLVRHPLYLFYFLELAALAAASLNLINAGLSIAFFILLLVRIGKEEEYLVSTYGQPYREYQKRSKKLIPFLL